MRMDRLVARMRRHFSTSAPSGGVVYITTDTTTVTERPVKRQRVESAKNASAS